MADAVEAAARTRAEENFMVGSRFRIIFFVGAVQLAQRQRAAARVQQRVNRFEFDTWKAKQGR